MSWTRGWSDLRREALGHGYVFGQLGPRCAAGDGNARPGHAIGDGRGDIGSVERGPGIEQHYVARRSLLVVQHLQQQRFRFGGTIDLQRAQIGQRNAEFSRQDLVFLDPVIAQLGHEGSAGQGYFVQAVTSVRDMSMGMVVKLAAVGVTLLATGGWMIGTAGDFVMEIFNHMQAMGH